MEGEMINWPFWLYYILFCQKGIGWNFRFKKFHTYGNIMHYSPIDSSFTYCRIYIAIGDWYLYPITCTAGYQPNAGMQLSLFHKRIFDCRKLAQRMVAKREGWKDWKDREYV